MEGKVAVLGDEDFVLPFSTLGLDTFAVDERSEEIEDSARKILEGKYSLVVVAENIAERAESVFSEVERKALPCIVVVPFTTEPTGYATESLSKVLRMATGTDIFQKS